MECPVFGGGGCSSQTIHPPSKLRYNRHILVVSTISRNDSCHPKLCRLRCTLVTSTPPKIPGSFLGLAKPYTEIQKFLTGVRSETLIRVCCFKHGLNRCRKSVEKAALYWSQKKKQNRFWWHLAELLRRFPQIFCASVHCGSTLIFQVLSKSVQVWGVISENPSVTPKVILIEALQTYNNTESVSVLKIRASKF